MSPIDKAIDPGRIGLSKSLMTGVCDRKSYYGETVRDANGWRLPFQASESVLFGKAIDVAHGYVVEHIRDGWDYWMQDAIVAGLTAAQLDEKAWAAIANPDALIREVEGAMLKFDKHPNGLEKLMPFIPGITIQGDNGESWKVDDLVGTPDYGLLDGVLDVKTTKYASGQWAYDAAAITSKPEMPWYAYMYARRTGAIPDRLIYQTYVRSGGGFWQWNEVAGTSAIVELGRLYAARARKMLALGDPDLIPFNTKWCGDCQFARPIPEVGFEGCAVGALMEVA